MNVWKNEIIALAACAAMFQPGCDREKAVAYAAAKSTPDQPRLFAVSREQLARLRVGAPRRVNWSVAVRTTGTVDWDATHTTQVIAQVSGPISRILADTGAMVRGGDPLLYVSSPDISAAIAAYKKARNQRDLAGQSLNRNKELLERGAIARKELEAAQAAYNDTVTDVQNSLQTLRIFGVSKQDLDQAEQQGAPISPELPVRSPIEGLVVQKLISPGQLVQAGQTTCFLVSDISTVWVQGHISDRDLPSVRVGDLADEVSASIPHPFHGVVSYIGAMVDASTRTTPVRIVTPNPRGMLKKDTFVEVVIHTKTAKNILAIPISAVLRTMENEPFVYVEAQPGQFARRLITTGAQQDGEVQVLSGLADDDRIVSEGGLFLQFAENNR
ncbi:MAG: Cobalt-zinc-cadmium resistance protein CzcB [Bryobacteraceae bacterium]|nr:Cobalt-zinc-cadmium resistance protein CzcB [Bryobacteraceae bacterium]